jgi:hypothetical protein
MILALVLAQAVEVEASASLWMLRIDGRLRFDERPFVGNGIDAREDWGWDRPAASPGVGLSADFDGDRVSLRAEAARFEGRERPDAPLRWNESLFQPGEEIRSELRLLQVAAGYERRLLSYGPIEVRAGAAARYVRAHVRTSAASPGRDDDNLGALLPELGLSARMTLESGWTARAEMAGTAFSALDLTARAYGASVLGGWAPWEGVSILVGWRIDGLSLVSRDRTQRNEVDVVLQGPVFEIKVQF